jgi:hypothetical protein
VLADLDSGLVKYLSSHTIPGEPVVVALDPPTRDWASKRTGPALNLFLADIREDAGMRSTNPSEIVDEQGQVVSRQSAPRYFCITYLLTAWTSSPDDDHRLLGAALIALLRQDYVPFDYCLGSLGEFADAGIPIRIRVGSRALSEKAYSELMTAVGGDYRPSLSVTVTLPVPAGIPTPAGPPQTVPPEIRLGKSRGQVSDTVRGRDPKDPDAGIRTRGSRDASASTSTT